MPLYTYKCPDCGVAEEDLVPMQDRDEPRVCKCGGVAVRTFQDVAARMKGDWAAWDNPHGEAAMRKMQKKHKGSVPDHIKERHSQVTPRGKQKRGGN